MTRARTKDRAFIHCFFIIFLLSCSVDAVSGKRLPPSLRSCRFWTICSIHSCFIALLLYEFNIVFVGSKGKNRLFPKESGKSIHFRMRYFQSAITPFPSLSSCVSEKRVEGSSHPDHPCNQIGAKIPRRPTKIFDFLRSLRMTDF